jgi:hypothetical protein
VTSIDLLKEFEDKVLLNFSSFMKKYDFCLHNHSNRIDSFGFSEFHFKKHNQFISISLSRLPQDQDIGIRVTLWANENFSTSLNFAVQYLTQSDTFKVYYYSINTIEKSLTDIQNDLELYLSDFLQGNLTTYAFVAGICSGQK